MANSQAAVPEGPSIDLSPAIAPFKLPSTKDLFLLLAHLLSAFATVLKPGGVKALVAENLLLRQQLLILRRSRLRALNLRAKDRLLLGFWSSFLSPCRRIRSAIILKPSSLFRFLRALKQRKYRLLFSATRKSKPGPKGPAPELIEAILQLKRRNPRCGCSRIAQQIAETFAIEVDKDVVRRFLAAHYRPEHADEGPNGGPVRSLSNSGVPGKHGSRGKRLEPSQVA